LLLLLVAPLVWYNGARREVRPSHQSPLKARYIELIRKCCFIFFSRHSSTENGTMIEEITYSIIF
ncbi:hypothetical protein, partial [Vibrio sp. 704]|uniref:hypothetical protein n=1 Tax=Vibrio sp. 704 TaxID=3074610 RepID=UPI0029640DCE